MAVSAVATTPAQTPAARLRQIGADALYLLTGLVTSIVAFCVWICGVTLSLTLGLLIIGFPIVLATFWCLGLLADFERKRAALVFGTPLASAYRPTPSDGRFGSRLRAAAHDPQRWKDLVYIGLHSVVGFVWGTVWLVLLGFVLGSITLPALVVGDCPTPPTTCGSRSTRGRSRSAPPPSASRCCRSSC